MSKSELKIIIGTPAHSSGSYIIDKFLDNQREIQSRYPYCRLVLAASEPDFAEELREKISRLKISAEVLPVSIIKPDYAKNRIWNIVSARNTIRDYFLNNASAEKLLFLDSDMIYDPDVVKIMECNLSNHDILFSGYCLRDNRLGLAGAGCLLLPRKTVEKFPFRCLEYQNGETIFEDNLLEYDLFSHHFRIKKGIFVNIKHYSSASKYYEIYPQKIKLCKRFSNSPFIRYCVIGLSIILHHNIAWKLFLLFNKGRKQRS